SRSTCLIECFAPRIDRALASPSPMAWTDNEAAYITPSTPLPSESTRLACMSSSKRLSTNSWTLAGSMGRGLGMRRRRTRLELLMTGQYLGPTHGIPTHFWNYLGYLRYASD